MRGRRISLGRGSSLVWLEGISGVRGVRITVELCMGIDRVLL